MAKARTRGNRRAARDRRTLQSRGSRNLVLVGVGLLCVVILAILAVVFVGNRTATTSTAARPMTAQQLLMSANIQQRFDTLNQAHTDFCANIGNQPAIDAAMAHMPPGSYLQGSCCSAMDFQHYQQQIAALKVYASIRQIPADPYNMPASLVNSLLQDDQTIALTPAQQTVYNRAASMTQDHGWCCCQCWAWYAHSGLAKYLITAHNFSAAQVATVTDLEDCCGG